MSEEFQKRSTKALIICIVLTVVFLALDLGSKHWAQNALSVERRGDIPALCEADADGRIRSQRLQSDVSVLIPNYLEFRYAENCGTAFSMLNSAPKWVRHGVFGLAALAASIGLFWMFIMGRGGPLFAHAVPWIVSGAIGNLVDRTRLGYVVDFIRFHIADAWAWPTFNVADITIAVGVGLLLIDSFLETKGAQNEKTAADTEAAAQ